MQCRGILLCKIQSTNPPANIILRNKNKSHLSEGIERAKALRRESVQRMNPPSYTRQTERLLRRQENKSAKDWHKKMPILGAEASGRYTTTQLLPSNCRQQNCTETSEL
jgi:hypothetical protein